MWRRVNQMKQQVNSGNADVDNQTYVSENSWRRKRKRTTRKDGELLEMIPAPSPGWMLSAPTSAWTWMMISATAGSLERC
jgi:hypothetical protein